MNRFVQSLECVALALLVLYLFGRFVGWWTFRSIPKGWRPTKRRGL